jgi:hypothetical protein
MRATSWAAECQLFSQAGFFSIELVAFSFDASVCLYVGFRLAANDIRISFETYTQFTSNMRWLLEHENWG